MIQTAKFIFRRLLIITSPSITPLLMIVTIALGVSISFGILIFYSGLNSTFFLEKKVNFIITNINDYIFICLIIFHFLKDTNLVYNYILLIKDILTELYNLNYRKLIITSCIFKTFIYISSTLFNFLNLNLTFLFVGILLLIGVSFYFSKNKLRFFVSLSFISFFWYIIGIMLDIFLLGGTLVLGAFSPSLDYHTNWNSLEYNLIFKQLYLETKYGKSLDYNFETFEFKIQNNYLIDLLSSFKFLDTILNPSKYNNVPSLFQEDTITSNYNKYFNSPNFKGLSKSCLVALDNSTDPSGIPLPPVPMAGSLSLMYNLSLGVDPCEVPLPPVTVSEYLYLRGADVFKVATSVKHGVEDYLKYDWDNTPKEYNSIFDTFPLLSPKIHHTYSYWDELHFRGEKHMTVDIPEFKALRDLDNIFIKNMDKHPYFRSIHDSITTYCLTIHNQYIMSVIENNDPRLTFFARKLSLDHDILMDLMPHLDACPYCWNGW